MSKQDFKDTLVYGKCRCGAAGQAGRRCAASGVENCPCCDNCHESCSNFLKELQEHIAAIMQAEIDKELIDGFKEQS